MKIITDKIYSFATNFVKIFTCLLMLLLFAGSFLLTCYSSDMNTQEVLTKGDSPLLSAVLLLLWIALFIGIAFVICKNPKRWKTLLLVITCGWILVIGCFCILFGRTTPSADAMSVYSAAELLAAGDTSVIHPTDSYFSYYPQQVGLMAFLEVLFRIWNLFGLSLPAYHFLKGIYVILLCIAVFFQYKSVHLLWENDKTDCLYLLLAGANLPMILYSSFLYGEIPSFAAFSAGLYFLLAFFANIRKNHPAGKTLLLHGIPGIFFLTWSVMLRKNTLILIIAILLVLGLEWLKTRRHILLVYTVLCAVLTLSILPLTVKYYENRADNTLSTGVTATSYLAMGMQEASRANGWYNGFNFNTYQESGMDTELSNRISRQAIEERMTYFKEHPDYALSFYTGKHLSQWADGTYASRQATISNAGGRHTLVHSLYDGELSLLYISYCNHYQNILYFGALIFCFAECIPFAKKEKDSLLTGLPMYIGLIGVIGGFLFHIMWEANSRYIFVYGLLLIPYAARGLSLLSNRVMRAS